MTDHRVDPGGISSRYKKLAESAIAQVPTTQLAAMASDQSNSIVVICWHVSGNLKSRFNDFLTPTARSRGATGTRSSTRAQSAAPSSWPSGRTAGAALFVALDELSDESLTKQVTIVASPSR